jgi:hypothetical protein
MDSVCALGEELKQGVVGLRVAVYGLRTAHAGLHHLHGASRSTVSEL